MARSPGFVRVELLREAAGPSRYRMVLRWQDADAAVGWRNSPVHAALQPALQALYADNAIEVYEVIA